MSAPRSLLDKVWDAHVVSAATDSTPATLYIDFHLIHEVTTPQAFATLRERGLKVRRPDRTLATMDHATPTDFERKGSGVVIRDKDAAAQIKALEDNCRAAGITLYGLDSDRQGIVHVIGPELGVTLPGRTIVCGDSHTSTHGAFGALAFGIGTSEVGHVLATQCLLLEKPKRMSVTFNGKLSKGVTAKDLILGLIAKIGAGGAVGHVIEYRGSTIAALSMEERMTLCNMAVEAGGRTGIIAPDETTFAYLKGRPYAPAGPSWMPVFIRWKCQLHRLRAGRVQIQHEHLLESRIQWAVVLSLESNAPAVGRPVRVEIGSRIERQPRLITAVRVHHINLAVAVARALEQDLAPIWRPVGGITRGELPEVGTICVHHVDLLVAHGPARERDLAAVRRPVRPNVASRRLIGDLFHSGAIEIDHEDF